jgi:hypothetical protein
MNQLLNLKQRCKRGEPKVDMNVLSERISVLIMSTNEIKSILQSSPSKHWSSSEILSVLEKIFAPLSELSLFVVLETIIKINLF